MDMKEKLEKANENIEELIDKIIARDKELNERYCCNPRQQAEKECDDCNKCKRKYYENVKDEMKEKYLIK